MSGKTDLFYLTEDEVKAIDNWTRAHQYSFSAGHFQLQFEFSPYGDSIVLCYHRGSNSDCLTVHDDWLRDNPARTVSQFIIDGVTIDLELSDETLEKYFQLGRASTKAHIDADCEPPGFGLTFEILKNLRNVFAGERLIASIQPESLPATPQG